PLAADVIEHAAAAAINDFRFLPVEPDEVNEIHIEISVLTAPEKLSYHQPEELYTLIRPGVDGVVIRDGARRATFLPQVWEQLPEMEDFMAHLCRKMGASGEYWKKNHLDVSVYQVIEFHE
ncbi:MAG: AmmeMemoRadiSam system protein A, partial [Anaerolineaceae bacterium]